LRIRIPALGQILVIAAAAFVGGVVVLGGQFAWRHLRGNSTDDPLAVVGGKPITPQAYRAEMERRGGVAAFQTPEERRALLDDMVRMAVLASDAEQAGYLQSSDVQHAIQVLLAQRYEQLMIDDPLAGLTVGEDEVAEYYHDHLAEFALPESVHVAVISLHVEDAAPQAAREAVRVRAQGLHERAVADPHGDVFAELAAQQSDDPDTRASGGEAGWWAAGEEATRWPEPVRNAAFALTASGQISPVIATPNGFYMVKLLDRISAGTRPLSEVYRGIEQQLIRAERQKRAAQLYNEALSKTELHINEAALAQMEAIQKAVSDVPTGTASPSAS